MKAAIIGAGLRLPGLKQLLYSTNINVSQYGAMASRLLVKKEHRQIGR